MRKLTIGYPLIRLESVDSTNNYAAQIIRSSRVTEGTVILAGYQTHGKGQGGNRWISDRGLNLLMSLIIRPDFIAADKQFYLSMCVSGAIHDYLATCLQPVMIKWPNDILARGEKIAGILIENTITNRNLNTSIIGIGVNVNQKHFPADVPSTTSLVLATGREYDLSDTLSGLTDHLNNHIVKLYGEKFAEIKTNYLNHLWRMNEWTGYSDNSGPFEGRIVDVTDSGALMVMHRGGGISHYGFKEIIYR